MNGRNCESNPFVVAVIVCPPSAITEVPSQAIEPSSHEVAIADASSAALMNLEQP
jgi:hypothetical protein